MTPGQSLGIASVPNLRDVGRYTNKEGKIVFPGIAYRSNQLNPKSAEDMKKIVALGLKNDYDLRTTEEAAKFPDEIPLFHLRWIKYYYVSDNIKQIN